MKKQALDTDLVARYLLNGGDNKSKEMIDRIIHDDENSRREFEEYVNVWEKSADVVDFEKIDTEKDWLKVRSRLNLRGTRKKIPLRSYLLRIAAIFIFALGLAYLLVEITKTTSRSDANYIELATLDEKKEVNLPDGSIVFLNKHSKIIRNNNFGINNRDIILEGEAFFEVASNKELPFKVHSLNSTIEVVGTSFNVQSGSLQVVVSVVTGKVAFYASENTTNRVELGKENTGIFEIDGEILTPKSSIDYNQLVWHTGEFIFNKVPLYQVCSTLASYYKLNFVPDPNVQFIDSVNGNFYANTPIEKIAQDISSALAEEDVVIITTDTKLFVRKQ
jgi:ferric-dicitrate binding protein FerR (iron transport regulator)